MTLVAGVVGIAVVVVSLLSGDVLGNQQDAGVFVDGEGHLHFNSSNHNDTSQGFVVNGVDLLSSISSLSELLEEQNATLSIQSERIMLQKSILQKLQCLGRAIKDVLVKGSEAFDEFPSPPQFNTPLLGANGRIYALSQYSSKGIEFDPLTEQLSVLPFTLTLTRSVAVTPNGLLVAFPRNILSGMYANNVIVLNTTKANITMQKATFGDVMLNEAWVGAVVGEDNLVYGIPYSHKSIITLNPETMDINTIVTIDYTSKWWGGVKAANGFIYCIPFDYFAVLLIDSRPNSNHNWNTIHLASLGGEKWAGGVLAPNGKIYGIPHGMNTVLIIDPERNVVDFSTITVSYSRWAQGVLGPQGRIFATPYHHTQNNVERNLLVIDPDTNSTDITTYSAGVGGCIGAVVANNRVYGFPFDGSTYFEVSFQCEI
eukprot:m.77923 g.77923  ORF g.77923 m.77923 type:complete len:428 (-) comp8556_c9_seq1:702-1985(-)